jgi:hypothetical protein
MKTKNQLKKLLRRKLHHVKGKNKRKRIKLDFYMFHPELIEVKEDRADVSPYRLKQLRVIEARKKRGGTRTQVKKELDQMEFFLKKKIILKKAA